MNYLPNFLEGRKRIIISPFGEIRAFTKANDFTTFQECRVGDFMISRGKKDKKLRVSKHTGFGRFTEIVSKKLNQPIIGLINKQAVIKEWFWNNEAKLPKDYIWTIAEIYENPRSIANHYGIETFLPELSIPQILDLVIQFKVVDIKNQVCKLDIESVREELDKPKKVDKVANRKQIRRLFECLPSEYADFIIKENVNKQNQIDNINAKSCSWRYAKKLPKSIAVGVLYDQGELKRFTDVITIDDEGVVKLQSLYTIGNAIVPVEDNLLFFGCDIPENVVKMIYVVHHINDDGEISSSWKLFAKRGK